MSRRAVGKKLAALKKSPSNKRFSETPKNKSPVKTRRNIIAQSSEISIEASAISGASPNRCSSITSNNVSFVADTSDFLKTWKVFRVSPIYNFHEKALKTYARKLKEEVAAFYYNSENYKYDCSFQYGKLSLLSKSCEIIKVSFCTNKKKYKGYFLSFQENQCKEASNFKQFPLLLVEGQGKIIQKVHNALCKFFDCDICPVRFTFKALTSFFASLSEMYIKDVSDDLPEVVTLQYKIPGCPESDKIQVDLSLSAASTVIAVIKSQFGSTLSQMQIVSGYYDRIVNHLLNVYSFNFVYAELCKVIFPEFAVSSEGWVKFASEDVLETTLPIIEKFSDLQYFLC